MFARDEPPGFVSMPLRIPLQASSLPDYRKHRGPHPEDHQLFCVNAVPGLQAATRDLSWLLTRGYAAKSATKLVGDRYCLDARQRIAVARCACSDDQARRRQHHEVQATELQHQELWIDGFNVLTSVEAALSGGVILQARDGCYRDMASMHGNYRRVDETIPAIHLLGETLAQWDVKRCYWLLDQPVSNSGRLKAMLLQESEEAGWRWESEVVPDPDPLLMRSNHIVASSDSRILDHANRWFNLAKAAILPSVGDAWLIDLSVGGN